MLDSIETRLIDFIRSTYDAMGLPGVVLLMALESACIPIPSELIMPFAGWFLGSDQGHGVTWVFLLALVGGFGNLIGSVVAYKIGAAGARPLLEKYGKYLLISKRDLATADRWFEKRGNLAIFVGRLLPVVRTFISLPAGMAKVNLLRFCVLTFLGSYLFSLGLAYGGYKLGEHWEDLRNAMRPFDIPIIIILAGLAALYIYRHVKHAREHETVKPPAKA